MFAEYNAFLSHKNMQALPCEAAKIKK